jgi:hypothetical protein
MPATTTATLNQGKKKKEMTKRQYKTGKIRGICAAAHLKIVCVATY